MKSLQGKTAIVTGSTSGIGLAIAKGLAEAGASIVLNGFGAPDEIKQIQEEIQATHKVPTHYASADVSNISEIQQMVEDTLVKFKSIDIIVNNAGVQFVAPVVDFPQEQWDKIIDLNLTSAFKMIKSTLPSMLSKNWGRIINIASAHGLVASPYKSAYVAAKHGLVGLTKSVALEVAETNVTCNAICPGYVRTPLIDKQIAEQAKIHHMPEAQVIKEVILKTQPNNKFIKAEDIAQMVVFLCSTAGDSMTGEIISMDGGWTAR